MVKLAKVLSGVMCCLDECSGCRECPYSSYGERGQDHECELLSDVREVYTELLSGSLARRIVEEAQEPDDGELTEDEDPEKVISNVDDGLPEFKEVGDLYRSMYGMYWEETDR